MHGASIFLCRPSLRAEVIVVKLRQVGEPDVNQRFPYEGQGDASGSSLHTIQGTGTELHCDQ